MKRLSDNGTCRLVLCGLLMAALTGTAGGCRAGGRLQVKELRTEYRLNPIGIGTPVPRLSWTLQSGERGDGQSAYRIMVAGSIPSLSKERKLLWDSGNVDSSESLNIPYAGIPLSSSRRCFWKVRVWDQNGRPSSWSRPAIWETALLHPEDWPAQWIFDGKPDPEEDSDFYRDDPAPLFRKAFSLPQKPIEARLYITGLGYYEARINGSRAGKSVLDPGWTDYADRILFSTFDVNSLLQKGENCLAVTLGNGWYNPLPLRMWGRLNLREHLSVGRPRLIAQLMLRFPDGGTRTVVSDPTWKVREGPLLRNNIYLGEVYDARLEISGWDSPHFDDSVWTLATAAPSPGGRLEAQMQPPVKITEEISAVRLTEPEPGTFIYDCGENFAGWIRMKVDAPKGTTIRLRYGELLYPDGSLNPMTGVCGQIKGFRSDGSPVGGPGAPEIAVQQDVYIAAGRGEEIYVPTFTYHAFRYVEVSGLPV
ncbi:MAG: family 78 glycoside hydrolase catalytic domain, partial [Candidatus Aminicenantes bacterium]|nr:family 78 glycoside hydrolase catalytic domain [Candidatus Aminicenantes bacterium]